MAEAIEKTKLNEAEAKLNFFQNTSAITYMHFKNIYQRDLKPESVMLCLSDKLLPIGKITDKVGK